MTNLIKRLEDIKTELFDTESNLLGSLDRTKESDLTGDKVRRIAQLRIHQAALSDAIKQLKTVKLYFNIPDMNNLVWDENKK